MNKSELEQNKRATDEVIKLLASYIYACEDIILPREINEFNEEFNEKFLTPSEDDPEYLEWLRKVNDGEEVVISDGRQCYDEGTYNYEMKFKFDKDINILQITFKGEITGFSYYGNYEADDPWSKQFNKTFTNLNFSQFKDCYKQNMNSFISDRMFIIKKIFDCF